jgi:hypothetical protein
VGPNQLVILTKPTRSSGISCRASTRSGSTPPPTHQHPQPLAELVTDQDTLTLGLAAGAAGLAAQYPAADRLARPPQGSTRIRHVCRRAFDTALNTRFRMILRRGFVVVVILLSLYAAAGCGSDQLTPAFALGVPTPSPPAGSSAPAVDADVSLAITIAAGKVSPSGANMRVRVGQRVQVTAVSDVAESIHFHGYDITLTLPPSVPGEITFTANQIGVFNIETHESGKLVATLIVS